MQTESIMDLPYNAASGLIETGAQPHRPGLAALRNWLVNRREAGRITRELQSYSDSDLADLGLRRGDIADVARGRFRRA
jgi:uncharacterized protein YjiS (DUF1127 family)